MNWDVENTDEFGSWFVDLSESDQDAIGFTVELLMAQGPSLRFPHSSGISNSRHAHMRIADSERRKAAARLLRLRSTPFGDPADRSVEIDNFTSSPG